MINLVIRALKGTHVIALGDDAAEQLTSPKRLADLESSGLLDSSDTGGLTALVQVAHSALGPDTTVLISAITADSQIIVSQVGGRETGLPAAPMSLTQSMCKYVVMGGGPDVIDDTAADPDHEAVVRGLSVGAYLGFPLHGPRGTILGAVCAVATEPRAWSPLEVQTMQSLTTAAEFVVGMIAMTRRERAVGKGTAAIDKRARIQHGLRTPLTSLLGLLDLLLDGHMGDFSDEQLEAIKRCSTNTHRLWAEVEALT